MWKSRTPQQRSCTAANPSVNAERSAAQGTVPSGKPTGLWHHAAKSHHISPKRLTRPCPIACAMPPRLECVALQNRKPPLVAAPTASGCGVQNYRTAASPRAKAGASTAACPARRPPVFNRSLPRRPTQARSDRAHQPQCSRLHARCPGHAQLLLCLTGRAALAETVSATSNIADGCVCGSTQGHHRRHLFHEMPQQVHGTSRLSARFRRSTERLQPRTRCCAAWLNHKRIANRPAPPQATSPSP